MRMFVWTLSVVTALITSCAHREPTIEEELANSEIAGFDWVKAVPVSDRVHAQSLKQAEERSEIEIVSKPVTKKSVKKFAKRQKQKRKFIARNKRRTRRVN